MLSYIAAAVFSLLLCRFLQIWLKYKFHPIPSHPYPLRKDLNVEVIAKSVRNGTLPKIFRPNMFPFSSYSNGYILSDFEMIKDAFSRKELSNRECSENERADLALTRQFIGLDEAALKILGPEDRLIKNGAGNFFGIGGGAYDDLHKSFRVMWFDTTKRLTGKNRIIEIIQQSSSSVNEILLREGGKEDGLDPKRVFMNGTMNVITGFAFGISLDFKDPVFIMIAKDLTTLFEYMATSLLKRTIAGKIPQFINNNPLYQKIWFTYFLKERNQALKNFNEYIYKQVVAHRSDLDKNNPRDYLDMLLIAAETEKRLGYDVIAATVQTIYLGASDTLANQLCWFCVTVADHPEVQQKMYEEIIASLENHNEIKKENCPFTRSVLLECQRWNPVGESMMHRASEDVVVDGVLIEKGSTLQASLTAVMHNPKNFPDPDKFIPDRFYKNGVFVNDVKVMSFSIGLRNCVGKQIAIDEYFIFSTNIIRDFKLSRKSKSMAVAKHGFLRMPENPKVQFEKRV